MPKSECKLAQVLSLLCTCGEDLVPWEPLLLVLLLMSWDGTPICLVSVSPTQRWHHFSEVWSCLDLEHLVPWR